VDIQSSRISTGSRDFRGSFKLALSAEGNYTRDLSWDSSAASVKSALEGAFLVEGFNVSTSSVSTYDKGWLVTFPSYAGNSLDLVLNADGINGTDLSAVMNPIQTGSTSMSGSYTLTLADTVVVLDLSDSVDEVQAAIMAVLGSSTSETILVSSTIDTSFNKMWEVIFPTILGNISTPQLDLSSTLGTNLSSHTQTTQQGSYETLGGTFTLTVEGETTTDIAFDAPAAALRTALIALSTVDDCSVTLDSGVYTLLGDRLNGSVWNISFDMQKANQTNNGIIDITLDSTSILGISGILGTSVATVVELQSGFGPYLPIEVTFDGVHFSSNGVLFEYISAMQLTSISPLLGPSQGGTVITLTLGAVESTAYALENYNIMCTFDGAIVPARFITDTTIECIAPPYASITTLLGGSVAVGVTLNSQENSLNTLQFAYRPATTGLTLYPTFGTLYGGTEVNITGSTLLPSGKCMFVCMYIHIQ
jgi:hypothetical protein